MQYREFEPIPIATLDAILLGISAVLVVASSIVAWRIWWTIILIGTTISDLPDPAAPIASGISKFVTRLRDAFSHSVEGLAQFTVRAARAMWRGLITLSGRRWQRALSVMAATSRHVLKALTDAVTSIWLLTSAVTVYLGKRLAWASKQF